MSKKIGTFYNTKLAQLRLATGKSTIDMEVLTGINSNVITSWETGKVENIDNSRIPVFKIYTYCSLLGINYEEFKKLINEAYWIRKRGKPEVFVTEHMTPLKDLRMKSHIKMEDLAATLNTPINTILSWENGNSKNPRNNVIKQLSVIYGITEDEMSKAFVDSYYMTHPDKFKKAKKIKVATIEKVTEAIEKAPEQPTVKPTTKSTVDIKEYDAMLERIYGQVSYEDFIAIKNMVENMRS